MTARSGSSRRIEQAQARFGQVAFAEWLGVTIREVAHDRAVLVLPYRPEHLNAAGVLNGGASASLVTMAGALAAWTGADLDADLHLSCVDLSVQYLAAAAEEDVMAEARVLRRGRGLVFLDVALRSQTGNLICQGLRSYQTSDYAGQTPRLRAQHALLPAPTPLIPPGGHRLFRGYVRKLDITPLHHSPGRVRLHMPCTAMHVDERGQLHAGALATAFAVQLQEQGAPTRIRRVERVGPRRLVGNDDAPLSELPHLECLGLQQHYCAHGSAIRVLAGVTPVGG